MTGNGGRSIADVVGDSISNIQRIAQAEIRLAKAEAREELADLRRGAIWCGVAAVAVFAGCAYVLLAGVDALALWLPGWAMAVAVGAAALMAGSVFAGVGIRLLRAPTLPRNASSFEREPDVN